MPKRFLTLGKQGELVVTRIHGSDPDGHKLAKVLFELSRTSDMTTHFNAAIHTQLAIAAGITGHRPLALVGSCDASELPTNRTFRDAWEWVD